MRDVQARLREIGFDPGPVDGVFGPRTKAAILAALGDRPQASMMQVSPQGVAFIAGHEGFVPGPYLDSVGVWTVYVGHTAAAGAPIPRDMPRGMPADAEAALAAGLAVFARDLRAYADEVRRAIRVPVAQAEFDAAVSFHFNTGAIGRAHWVRSLNAGDRAGAAREIMNWRSPPSIVERRRAEQRLFRDGLYDAKPMPVWPVDTRGRITWRALALIPAEAVAQMVQEVRA